MRKPKAFWDLYTDGITRSALEKFMRCPEEFRIAYVEGLRTKRESYAAHFGNVIHECLDKLYSAWEKTGKRKGITVQVWGKVWLSQHLKAEYSREHLELRKANLLSDEKQLTDLVKIYGLTEVLANAYLDFWEKDFQTRKWLALEEEFDIKYPCPVTGKPIRLRGKRDGDFEISRKIGLIETKSKGRIDTGFLADKIPIDLQVNLYLWAQWKDYGRVPYGVLYNLIRRPQLEQRVNETVDAYISRVKEDVGKRPDFYFIRFEGHTTKAELLQFENVELKGVLTSLVHWLQGLYHYKNSAACQTPWGSCDNLRLCSRGDSDHLQKRDRPFTELEV